MSLPPPTSPGGKSRGSQLVSCFKDEPHLFLGLLDSVGVVVGVLEGGDDTLLAARDLRVEALDLLTGRDGVPQLGHRGQQPRAVHTHLAVLFADPELHREEVQL